MQRVKLQYFSLTGSRLLPPLSGISAVLFSGLFFVCRTFPVWEMLPVSFRAFPSVLCHDLYSKAPTFSRLKLGILVVLYFKPVVVFVIAFLLLEDFRSIFLGSPFPNYYSDSPLFSSLYRLQLFNDSVRAELSAFWFCRSYSLRTPVLHLILSVVGEVVYLGLLPHQSRDTTVPSFSERDFFTSSNRPSLMASIFRPLRSSLVASVFSPLRFFR